MHVNITDADIYVARQRDKSAGEHAWHNPLAIAAERMHGGFAIVTHDMIHISSDGFSGSFMLTDVAKCFMLDWVRGRVEPVASLFVGRPAP